MGSAHAKQIYNRQIPNAELSAVCDINPERLSWAKNTFGDSVQLFETKSCDAIFIATPHYDHPNLAIQSLQNNYHTLIEKPAGVYTKAVRQMNEVAEQSDKIFGIMYNQRTNPLYQKVKDLIETGE